MKPQTNFMIIRYTLLFLIIIPAFMVGYSTARYSELKIQESNKISTGNYLIDCENMSLEETSYCLVEFVRPFFNYTVRDDYEKSLENIKKYGGDCYDYNTLYKKMGNELGFDGYTFRIETKKGDFAHRIAILIDNSGYCLLDQLEEPRCIYFDLEKLED